MIIGPWMIATLVGIALVCVLALWLLAVMASRPTRTTWGQVALVALAIAAGRLALVAVYGEPVPFWDQWDGEGGNLLRPWLDGQLTWSHLVAPHNEHRIVFTRLEVLGLFICSGVWDPTQQMAFNALLHGIAGSLVWLIAARHLGMGGQALIGVVTVLVMANPLQWENILAGFQSQFSYCLLFTCSALLLAQRALASWWWWMAFAFAMLAVLGTLGGGFLAVPAVVIVILLHGWSSSAWRSSRLWSSLGWCCIVLACGAVMLPHVARHEVLRAQDMGELLAAFRRTAGWPAPGAWPLLWGPLLLFALPAVRRWCMSVAPVHLGLLVWVLGQGLAVSYARGAGGAGPADRYLDLIAISLPLLAAMLCIAGEAVSVRLSVRVATWAVWMLSWLPGVMDKSMESITYADDRQRLGRRHIDVIQQYVATKDASLMRLAPLQDLPFPSGDYLKECLDNSSLTRVLHFSMKCSIKMVGEGRGFGHPGHFSFSRGTRPDSIGSYLAPDGDATQGEWSSAQMQVVAPMLMIPVTGYLGSPGLELRIVWADGESQSLSNGKPPRESWQERWITNRYMPFRMEAVDASSTQWLAWCPPTPVTWWDRVRAALNKRVHVLVSLALLALMGMVVISLQPQRHATGSS